MEGCAQVTLRKVRLLLHSQSALKQLLWESLTDDFQQYFE